jgi:septum formation protein
MSDAGQPRLVLASRSPRRRALLMELGLAHACDAAAGDGAPVSDDPAERVLGHARHKATEVAARHPACRVLAADTLVEADGVFFPQPVDRADAESMLRKLADRDHHVWTGTVLLSPTGAVQERVDRAVVRFAGPSEDSLQAWLESGQWQGKAGAYGIQDEGVEWAELVDGSRGTVVGMCAETVLDLLS